MLSFPKNTVQGFQYGLLTLCTLVSVLQWQAVLHRDDPELFATNLLIFLAIASRLWDRRHHLTLSTPPIRGSTVVGSAIILLMLLRSWYPAGYHPRISLLLTGIGLSLLAASWQGLRLYGRELGLTALLILTPLITLLLQVIDLPLMTAQFSAIALSILGFSAEQQGYFVHLPTGRVEVYGACSGIGSIVQMFNLSVVLAVILPAKSWVKQLSFILAPILGFGVNALRIALLTVLIAQGNQAGFDYWHTEPNASLVFFLIASLLFMLFYYGCLQYFQGAQPAASQS